ncbi:MAG: DUF418 domain-containing protein, partial [Pseudomonadota bacterium]
GDFSGINRLVFVFNHLFADQKFMTIFSLLFGAGIALVAERAEARDRSPTGLHYRRMYWLLVLGAIHAYLLWYGDILVIYSLCGLVVYWFHRRRPTTQIVIGLLMLAVSSAVYFLFGSSLPNWPEEAREGMLEGWAPSAELIAAELAAYRGSWSDQFAERAPTAAEFHTVVFLVWGFWRAGGLMVLGMALYHWGFFSAQFQPARYRWLAAVGLGLGLPIVAIGLWQHEAHGWSFEYSFFQGAQFNYWGSLLVAVGYTSLVMLWFQSGRLVALRHRLAAVGRMAFSNYIAQTLICTTLFYGFGLGWFGHAERWQQMIVVLCVWMLLLVWSPWWLARFRFGPLEWLWRTLTYGRLQPLRKTGAAGA